MSGIPFKVQRHPDVEGFIAKMDRVPKYQVERDIEKLESRGLRASEPLVGHIAGPVYELRSKVGKEIFRTAYYQNGEYSFHAFYIYQKKSKRMPLRVKAAILKKYEEITRKSL